MVKEEFIEGIKKIQNAYNTTFNVDKLQLWWNKLQFVDGKVFKEKVDKLIVTNKYIPSLAEIVDNEKPSIKYANYDQREYKDIDFNNFYAN